MSTLGEFQKNIDELNMLPDSRYENIFRVFTKQGKYIYNILKTVNIDTESIPPSYYQTTKTVTESPYTFISYSAYNTTDLWWLIYIINKDILKSPIELIPGGTKLKILKIDKVRDVLDQISIMLNPPST